MRSIQKINKKAPPKPNKAKLEDGVRYIVLKPAGYPLRSELNEYPEISESKVFEFYAREQWNGLVAKSGDYLFDRRMFPDFAFEIVNVIPEGSFISHSTAFFIENMECDDLVPKIISDVDIKDVIGQDRAKRKCKLIMKYLDDPEGFGKWAPKNILFHGPSGTGKTMLAKALANDAQVPILPMKATQIIGEFVGDGARQIHQLYERAEDYAPCIIFIDELDAIGLDRRFQELRGDVIEIVNALLTEMDGIDEHKGVCTIAATNRVESIDTAIRSRFEEEIEFIKPDKKERLMILNSNISSFPIEIDSNFDIKTLVEKTEGMSGRDLVEKILKNALHAAILEDSKVLNRHFEEACKKVDLLNIPKNSDEGMYS
ncbi:MAG: AAA family ATPase [Methanosarcinales archaeon]|nr:AAA family ATPase [Methanosarcinales archaeon]